MTRATAIYNFFNSIDEEIPAYPDTNVPKIAPLPYITYSMSDAQAFDSVSITVQMWFRTESEAIPNRAMEKLKDKLGIAGKVLLYDGGGVWVKSGTPFSISTTLENDTTIKIRQINIDLENLS